MIDTHVHLNDKRYGKDTEKIIADFACDDIDFVVNNSYDKKSMLQGVALSEKFARVFCTVGMHPHDAKDFDCEFEKLMTELAKKDKVVAVGEIGLDYHYDFSPRQIQRDVFARQIELADKLSLPIVLHVRESYGDVLDILKAQKKYLNNEILWHCFSGSAELARQLALDGHYIAFGGAITFKNARKEEVVRSVPFDRILSETDCPYMTPEPFRGQVNFPKYVRLVILKLAEIYGKTFQETVLQIEKNCKKCFPKITEIGAQNG